MAVNIIPLIYFVEQQQDTKEEPEVTAQTMTRCSVTVNNFLKSSLI